MPDILTEANAAVNDRHTAYDVPERNFGRIAQVWSVILGKIITAEDVALCMIGLKLCRELYSHKRDNLTDIIGYTVCLEELHEGATDAARDEAEDKALYGTRASGGSDWRSSPDLYLTPAPWETQPQWRVTC